MKKIFLVLSVLIVSSQAISIEEYKKERQDQQNSFINSCMNKNQTLPMYKYCKCMWEGSTYFYSNDDITLMDSKEGDYNNWLNKIKTESFRNECIGMAR